MNKAKDVLLLISKDTCDYQFPLKLSLQLIKALTEMAEFCRLTLEHGECAERMMVLGSLRYMILKAHALEIGLVGNKTEL